MHLEPNYIVTSLAIKRRYEAFLIAERRFKDDLFYALMEVRRMRFWRRRWWRSLKVLVRRRSWYA